MATQDWFILTAAERSAAMAFNTQFAEIDPRAVDNASPGVAVNLNPDATNYPDGGEVVTLVGNYVAPKRIVDDPDYQASTPDMITFLLTLPWATLEDETIFAPIVI